MIARLQVLSLLLLMGLASLGQAQTLSLPATTQWLLPGPYMEFWRDPNGQATLAEVQALPDSAWRALKQGKASFGYDGHAYWLRLTLHNPQRKAADWLLVIDNPLLDYLDAYGLEGQRVYQAGDHRPFHQRWIEHRQPVLPVRLAAGEERQLLLRIQTQGSANLNASLMNESAFAHREQRALLLHGLFFGALAVMAVYNLFVFLITRDGNYLWYSLFVASFGLCQLILLGFAFQWLWPQTPDWQQISFPLSIAITSFFGVQFTYGVLELRNGPPFYAWTNRLVLGSCMVVAGLALFAPYRLALMAGFAVIFVGALLACGYTAQGWRVGNKAARLYAAGWFVLIGAALVSIVASAGLIGNALPGYYVLQIGALIELLVFAVALAARIRQAQSAQQQSQALLLAQERELRLEHGRRLELQRQINEGLETRVLERTAALEKVLEELSQVNQQLGELNRRDGLTGLFNRQTLNEELARALEQAKRSRQPIAVLMMDLDFFKQVNDKYGHLAGDACLRHAAEHLYQRLRGSDLLARFGGEEFVAILPGTNMTGASELAQQLCDALAQHPCQYAGKSISLTLSIGICACVPELERLPEQLLHQADEALYRAKAAGRNRVECYEASLLGSA